MNPGLKGLDDVEALDHVVMTLGPGDPVRVTDDGETHEMTRAECREEYGQRIDETAPLADFTETRT